MDVLTSLNDLPADAVFDTVVIGAGGAGMATALFSALHGQRVLLVERTGLVGGTTALSAGTTWVPGTTIGRQVNPTDTLAEAARYLDHAIGDRTPAAMRQAFLDHGEATIAFAQARTELRFRPYARHPDYLSELPGASLNGRALEPEPFDGRLLGPLLALVRPPIPEFTVLGGMMVDRTDINHLLGMTRSFTSMRHCARILLRHASDRLRHPRGTRLVMGNALVARLLYSLSRHAGVSLLLHSEVARFHQEGDRLTGATLRAGSVERPVAARAGVVLASGGFNRDPALRAQWLPGIDIAWCPAAPGHTGGAHAPARAVGAAYGQGAVNPAFWAPVSLRQRADGSTAAFPHFVMDRAKPGMLTVNQAGRRFVNESTSYHLFALAMLEAHRHTPSIPAYLVCDTTALRRYGIGMVRPGASLRTLAPFLADGYLTCGETLDALAQRLGIDAAGLRDTVATMNRHAEQGADPDFQRGVTAYQQNIGDPAAGYRNPNLGPLRTPPFYAVRLLPGDIGAATGFATDAQARVLDATGQPIEGLYAVGNDMHSIMGGVYTAPGITIGPGLVFAHLAAAHLAARTQGKPEFRSIVARS